MESNADSAVNLDGIEVDDPRRRLKNLSLGEIQQEYKKGFKLLQKAGFKRGDGLAPPLRVAIRNPREGLKDDDLEGRKGLGETKKGPLKRARTSGSAQPIPDKKLEDVLPSIAAFLDRQGGSASVSEVLDQCLRPLVPGISRRSFLVAARVFGTLQYGFKISETDGDLILTRPTAPILKSVPCVCGQKFESMTVWTRHVIKTLDKGHEAYMNLLRGYGPTTVYCLVCGASFLGIGKLILHAAHASDHLVFGYALVNAFINSSVVPEYANLLLQALEDDDKSFPWGGTMTTEDPPTPIHLDDDDDDGEVIEILEDTNFINLED
jgi:hypothetical protein